MIEHFLLVPSDLTRASLGACRVPFIFVFITIFYVFWLMTKYYRAYVVLRQHYLTGGERLLNEWHAHFMERQASDQDTRKKNTALFILRHMFDVNAQVRASIPC